MFSYLDETKRATEVAAALGSVVGGVELAENLKEVFGRVNRTEEGKIHVGAGQVVPVGCTTRKHVGLENGACDSLISSCCSFWQRGLAKDCPSSMHMLFRLFNTRFSHCA